MDKEEELKNKYKIIEFYKLIYNIQDLKALSILSDISTVKFIKKQTTFIKANETKKDIYILISGLAYYYYSKSKTRDIIDRFYYKPGDVILENEKSNPRKNIRSFQTLRDCEFIVIPYDLIQESAKKNDTILSFLIFLLKQEIIEYQNLCFMRSLSPEKRILYFLDNHKDLSPILTNIEIAKFLDMNRQEFSKKLKLCKMNQ